MRVVLLKQKKPQQAFIFGFVLLLLTPVLWYFNENSIDKILLVLVIGLGIIGYSFTYEIRREFDNYKRFNLFGIMIWKQKMELLFPDYISLFSASFKKDNDWGAVAALGTQSKNQGVVIKFFKGPKNEIIYRSDDYDEALLRAKELSALLDVKIHDTIKK